MSAPPIRIELTIETTATVALLQRVVEALPGQILHMAVAGSRPGSGPAASELAGIRAHHDPGTVPPPFGQSVDAAVRVNTDDSGL